MHLAVRAEEEEVVVRVFVSLFVHIPVRGRTWWVLYSEETWGDWVLRGGRRAADDRLSRADDLLPPPLCFSAAPAPHRDTMCQHALCGGAVKGHLQLLTQVILPGSEAATTPAWWPLRCLQSRIGDERWKCSGVCRLGPSAHGHCWCRGGPGLCWSSWGQSQVDYWTISWLFQDLISWIKCGVTHTHTLAKWTDHPSGCSCNVCDRTWIMTSALSWLLITLGLKEELWGDRPSEHGKKSQCCCWTSLKSPQLLLFLDDTGDFGECAGGYFLPFSLSHTQPPVHNLSHSPTLILSFHYKAVVNVPRPHYWWQMVKAEWKLPK